MTHTQTEYRVTLSGYRQDQLSADELEMLLRYGLSLPVAVKEVEELP